PAGGGLAGKAGRAGGEVPADRRGDDAVTGEAAEGGYSGDAFWAGVGAVLEGRNRFTLMPRQRPRPHSTSFPSSGGGGCPGSGTGAAEGALAPEISDTRSAAPMGPGSAKNSP